MKEIFLVVLILFLVGCNEEKVIDGKLILEKAIVEHDSLSNWNKVKLNLHIQEPRISNPYRYSIITLDNSNDSFKLKRNRDQYISEHIVNSDGNSFTLLNGQTAVDSILIKKYRLNAARNIGYKNFYKLLYGLPMSLNNYLEEIITTSESIFNEEECYKIEMQLKEPVISEYWNLFVSKSDLEIKGIEILLPDKPDGGDRIYFDKLITVGGIKIPRVRHWHEFKDDTYSGTDLIIKELKE
ncbi:MAG: DUF6503 family protein [Bacteroidota bacterium]